MSLLRSPALHFFVIGGLLFAAAIWRGAITALDERPELVIPRYRINLALKQFAETSGQPLTPTEEKRIVDSLIDQEVLYRYALRLGMHKAPVAERRLAQIAAFVERNPRDNRTQAQRAREAVNLGLHQGDLVVRRILIDGARRLIRAAALVRQPTDAMLQAYLKQNPDLFMLPAKTRITHITVNRLKHGDGTDKRARIILEKLHSGSYAPHDAIAFGDNAFVPPLLPLLTDNDLARRFGYRFVEVLNTVPEGVWQGPIPSRYGFEIVFVHERREPYVPPLRKIRKSVKHHFLQKFADEWLAFRLGQLRAEFEIVVPGSQS